MRTFLPVGTRSLLFGVHQIFIHPWFVARAWWRLYGFPRDPRLWVAFFVHDLGYWGCRDMDGDEGERHVELGAKIMLKLFDGKPNDRGTPANYQFFGLKVDRTQKTWHDFCLFHSRFYAKKAGFPFSRLCVADKAAIYETPRWLYLPLARLSGEVDEYVARVKNGKYSHMIQIGGDKIVDMWYSEMCSYLRRWVAAHKDSEGLDSWTKV